MIFTYKELLLKYKSAYQIEKAIKNGKVYKIEKGIYSDIHNVHYLEIIMKKYPYGVLSSYSAYYYYNLTDTIPKKIYFKFGDCSFFNFISAYCLQYLNRQCRWGQV